MRIAIRGTTGSGKSTLAAKVAERTGIPRIELDDLFHLPGWQSRTPEEFRALVAAVTADESWVIAGNYSAVNDLIEPRQDTLVWLDYPFTFNFFRLLRRTILRLSSQETICNGNRESLRKTLSQDSILVWFLRTHRRRRQQCEAFFAAPPEGLTVVRCRTPKDAERWLESL